MDYIKQYHQAWENFLADKKVEGVSVLPLPLIWEFIQSQDDRRRALVSMLALADQEEDESAWYRILAVWLEGEIDNEAISGVLRKKRSWHTYEGLKNAYNPLNAQKMAYYPLTPDLESTLAFPNMENFLEMLDLFVLESGSDTSLGEVLYDWLTFCRIFNYDALGFWSHRMNHYFNTRMFVDPEDVLDQITLFVAWYGAAVGMEHPVVRDMVEDFAKFTPPPPEPLPSHNILRNDALKRLHNEMGLGPTDLSLLTWEQVFSDMRPQMVTTLKYWFRFTSGQGPVFNLSRQQIWRILKTGIDT